MLFVRDSLTYVILVVLVCVIQVLGYHTLIESIQNMLTLNPYCFASNPQ